VAVDVDERQVLTALLAAVDDPARAPSLPDDAPTLDLARRHRLTPMLSIGARGALPEKLDEACRRDHVLTVARHLALTAVAEECVAALAAAGVQAALLKGLAYASLYPLGARPTSDVDLLVRAGDRRRAFQVLDGLGFEPRAASPGFDDPDYHEVAWQRGGVEIDLHMALAPLVRCAIDYDEVWGGVRELPVGGASAYTLAPAHAVVFHALHMAIDHFDVPALYLVDLARLAPDAAALAAAAATARAWRCERPLQTSAALAGAFQPRWPAAQALGAGWAARRVIDGFGGTASLSRPEQLLRKLAHFDALTDAARYTRVQAGRKARDLIERRVRRRTARERLNLP
jgi:hypothetical protein